MSETLQHILRLQQDMLFAVPSHVRSVQNPGICEWEGGLRRQVSFYKGFVLLLYLICSTSAFQRFLTYRNTCRNTEFSSTCLCPKKPPNKPRTDKFAIITCRSASSGVTWQLNSPPLSLQLDHVTTLSDWSSLSFCRYS